MKYRLIRLLLLVAISPPLFSQVPGTLSYQGILLENDGITPLEGAHTIEFNFYTVSTGGTPDVGLTRTVSVTATKGLFTCIIGDGSVNNAALPSSLGSQEMYIGIKVDGGAELLPRARLTPAAYAYQAQSAYTMDATGLTGTIDNARLDADLQDLADGTLNGPGKVSGDAITSGKIGGSTEISTLANIATAGTLTVTGTTTLKNAIGLGAVPDFGTSGQFLTSQGPGVPPIWSSTVSAWGLAGNSGTTPGIGAALGTSFIGTTDDKAFDFVTNNTVKLRLTAKGQLETYNTGQSVFIGEGAGASDDLSSNQNVFVGYKAGSSNTGGLNNTASGYSALYSNTTGTFNTANGAYALNANTTGHNNTASGGYALFSNVSGSYNSANGESALRLNTIGWSNTGSGSGALNNNTVGNGNTSIGTNALYSNVAGSNATAIGGGAMYYANNTTTAFTNYNVAVGYEALRGSTTASNNTGNDNTTVGYQSLRDNSTGSRNTANGASALYSNASGSDNTANGNSVLYYNTTGLYNTANGSFALYANTTGHRNTANGADALYSNTIGYYNSAFGLSAGSNVTSGSNLTLLGYDAEPSSATATNQITLGNNAVTSLRCNVQVITSLSDARDKKNIRDLSTGLDFLMQLKPRQFQWDRREWYYNGSPDGSKMQATPTAGFIAQELDEVQSNANAEWLNLVLKDNPEKWEATYGNLLPVMVKAIQEQQSEIEELKSTNEILMQRLQAIEALLIRNTDSPLGHVSKADKP